MVNLYGEASPPLRPRRALLIRSIDRALGSSKFAELLWNARKKHHATAKRSQLPYVSPESDGNPAISSGVSYLITISFGGNTKGIRLTKLVHGPSAP